MTASATSTDSLWFLNTRVTIQVSTTDGADGLSVIANHGPRDDSPPLHIHHTEDEVFHVVDGELRVRLGDEELLLRPGETLNAPKGVPHTYRVESATARWLAVTTHGDFERFVRSTGRPAAGPGLPDAAGPPTAEQSEALAKAAREHGIELVGPPLAPTARS